MADDPNTPEPTPAPAPASEPEWAINLRRSIEELPGKLRATVTDDDKRDIGQAVYDFFDQGGAIKREETKPEEQNKPEETPEVQPDNPPKKVSGLAKFASWFAGE